MWIPIALLAVGAYAVKRWFDGKGAAPAPTGATPGPMADAGPPAPQDQGGSSGGGGGGGSAGPYDPGYPMNVDPGYVGPTAVPFTAPLPRLAALKASAMKNPVGPIVDRSSLLLGAQPAPSGPSLPSNLRIVAPTAPVLSSQAVVPSNVTLGTRGRIVGR